MNAPTVVLSPFTSTFVTELPSISLLPFQIAYDGIAPISTYFTTRSRISTSKSSPTSSGPLSEPSLPLLQASFRGRHVLSTPISLPKGFTGIIFSTTTPTVSITSNSDKGDEKRNNNSNKRVKLTSNARNDATEGGKGKGKEIVLGSINGRRTSPRKKVAVVKYAMDSEEENDDEDTEETYRPEAGETMEVEEVSVQIEVTAPSSPLASPSSEILSPAKPRHPSASASSIFSITSKSETVAVEESSTNGIRDVQELIPEVIFNGIQIWNSDYELDQQEDVFVKTLIEWAGISQKLHAY